ncbi:MAG: SDR family oxidoreductase [Solirubrobacterales bacterium]
MSKTIPIQDATVVVTGASAGLGRAIVRALGTRGCSVGLIARDGARLEAAAREVRDAGGRALPIPCDVADAAAVEDAASRTEAAFGPIDTWINTAMVTVYSRLADMTAGEFRRVTEVTYLGYVHGTMSALKRMRRRNRGTIVQVGSSLAYRGIPLQSAYCGAKFAIRGFTDALRCELIHDRSPIRLTMVQIPALNTPQFDWARNHMGRRPQPVPPIHQPEPVAEAVIRAAEQAPRELWVDPSTVKVIAGAMVAPATLDKLLARRAWDGELSRQIEQPGRADNLFSPVAGNWAAHGRFDRVSLPRAPAFSEGMVRGTAVAAGMLLFAAALAVPRLGTRR